MPIEWYKGNIFLEDKDFENAEEHFWDALDLAPYNAIIYNDLGVVNWMQGDPKAESYFKKALFYSSNFQEVHLNLANYYYNKNDKKKSLYHLNRVTYPSLIVGRNKLINCCPPRVRSS